MTRRCWHDDDGRRRGSEHARGGGAGGRSGGGGSGPERVGLGGGGALLGGVARRLLGLERASRRIELALERHFGAPLDAQRLSMLGVGLGVLACVSVACHTAAAAYPSHFASQRRELLIGGGCCCGIVAAVRAGVGKLLLERGVGGAKIAQLRLQLGARLAVGGRLSLRRALVGVGAIELCLQVPFARRRCARRRLF